MFTFLKRFHSFLICFEVYLTLKPQLYNSNMIQIKNYHLYKKKDSFVVVPDEPVRCECGGKVIKRGSKGRYIINNEGVRNRYILKRVYCPASLDKFGKCDKMRANKAKEFKTQCNIT